MNQKILAFSGSKQSGKTTSVRFLHGYEMKRNNVIDHFDMNDTGELIVSAVSMDENGNSVDGYGILDIDRKDGEFAAYAEGNIWPFVKSYNFAEPLKQICMQLFNLSHDQCYGTDKQKNTDTSIKRSNVAKLINNNITTSPTEYISAREFMQIFGTDVCRSLYPTVWTDLCVKRILSEQSGLSLVGDCRFLTEFEALKSVGGKIIRLTKGKCDDGHSSETDLNENNFDWNNFDLVLDNRSMSIKEQSRAILEALHKWGWLEIDMEKQNNVSSN